MLKTLNIEECAALLMVDKKTAQRLARKGELPGVKIGRAWVFREEDVMAFLDEQVREQVAKRLRSQEPVEPLAIFVGVPKKRKRRPLPRLPELPANFDPTVFEKKKW